MWLIQEGRDLPAESFHAASNILFVEQSEVQT